MNITLKKPGVVVIALGDWRNRLLFGDDPPSQYGLVQILGRGNA